MPPTMTRAAIEAVRHYLGVCMEEAPMGTAIVLGRDLNTETQDELVLEPRPKGKRIARALALAGDI